MAKKNITYSFTMDGKAYDPSKETQETKQKRNIEAMRLAGFQIVQKKGEKDGII